MKRCQGEKKRKSYLTSAHTPQPPQGAREGQQRSTAASARLSRRGRRHSGRLAAGKAQERRHHNNVPIFFFVYQSSGWTSFTVRHLFVARPTYFFFLSQGLGLKRGTRAYRADRYIMSSTGSIAKQNAGLDCAIVA